MKNIYVQFVVSIAIWFWIFYGIAYISQAEWLIIGKYYLTAIVMSFFIGARVGIFLIKKALEKELTK